MKNKEISKDILVSAFDFENKFPLLVTHKHTARVLMKHLLKISDEEFEFYELPNKKILLIELNNSFEYIKHDEIEY